MRNQKLMYIVSLIFFATFLFAFNFDSPELDHHTNATKNISSLSNSEEPFEIMMQVIAHQRCVNCHPSGDRPRQGDENRVHNFNIQRGEDGHGMLNAKCSTCHQSENNNFSGVPGAPHWHLAPKSMAWEGLSKLEIAQSMLDKSKNGGRSIEEIGKHLTGDLLVLWAFDPGINNEGVPREKPPVSKEDYLKAVKQWIAEGAVIPKE